MKQNGLLLINLGTPRASTTAAVKSYLHEFLMDKRVIDLPYLLRAILVYGIITPFRSHKSAKNYQKIWTKQGSPLAIHTQDLCQKLQKQLSNTKVVYAMRYGPSSIAEGLAALKDCQSIQVLPLYPQYASATSGSSIQALMDELRQWTIIPKLKIIKDFYRHPAYIRALAASIPMPLKEKQHILFSYHGLPERSLKKAGCAHMCSSICPNQANQNCYRWQCFQTSVALAKALDLSSSQYTTSFQSRLGKAAWIRPYTDEILTELRQNGIEDLIVACPSFVADCLETLEEIGIGTKDKWLALGGKNFHLIPCLNASEAWLTAIQEIIND